MRKLFFSSLALFLLVIILLLAYNFAFKNNAREAKITPTKEGKSEESSAFGKEETPSPSTVIANPINENILSAATGPSDTLVYYSLDDKAFKRSSLEGKDKVVLLSNLPGKPTRIVWSPKRDSALLLVEETGGSHWYTAIFSTKTLSPLKKEITRATWNSLGDKIFYLFKNPASGEYSLNRANPDGSDWKELLKLGNRNVFLGTVPQASQVSFWTRPNALEESFFDLVENGEGDHLKVFSGRFGGDYLWSPNGEKVLVSSALTRGGALSLGVMNKKGGEFQSLNIPTLISKVVWSKDGTRIFYALPGGLDQALLPNDYYEKNLASQDTFWQLDIETGKSRRLLELSDIGQSFDSTDLSLSNDERALFFVDRQSQRLHRIDF